MNYLFYLLLLLLIPFEAAGQVTTTTPNIGLTKPCVPGDAGCLPTGHPGWGPIINTDLDIIDAKIPTLNLACTDGQFPTWANNKFSVCGTPATVASVTGGAFALTGDITPSTITSDQNNYNPTGLSTASVLRLATDASRSITGLAGGSDGRIIFIYNAGANSLSLTNESGSSVEANRFAINASITLAANQGIILQYDGTSLRWRAASGISGGGGGQAADDDLTAIAALSCTGGVFRTGANTFTCRTITAGAGIGVTNGDGVSGAPTIAVDSTVWRTTGGTASTGNHDYSQAISLNVPEAAGAAPTDNGRIAYNTTTNRAVMAMNSTTEVLATSSDIAALSINGLADLDTDALPTVYPLTTIQAGPPSAGAVTRAGTFHFDTTNSILKCGFTAAGNFLTCFEGSAYNELFDGTNSANAAGGEGIAFLGAASLATSTLVLDGTGTFTTQPSNDAIQLVSSSASDTQNAVVYGTTNGGDASAVIMETVALSGTTPVTTTKTDWGVIYAVKLASAAVGNVTVREDSGDVTICTIADTTTHCANQDTVFFKSSSTLSNHVKSQTLLLSADGTQCGDPAYVQINSGWRGPAITCTDNDASTIFGMGQVPDSWAGGTFTVELQYVQTAADTNALNSDISASCRSAGDTMNNTWGTEVAMDDAAVTGSSGLDHLTSAAITPHGTCAAGDTIFVRWQMDAAGTTTAVATLRFLAMKMEYTVTGAGSD